MEVKPLFRGAACALVLGLSSASISLAQDASRTISHNTPSFVSTAKDLGPEEVSKQITVYLWLGMHNPDALRELVQEQHEQGSANYHRWLTREEFADRFAPSSREVGAVQTFLTAHNLRVVSVGERNLYVKATGTVADAQRAFNVQIHRFDVNGRIQRSNLADPSVAGPAGSLVTRVGGLSEEVFQPHAARAMNPETHEPFKATPLSVVPNGAFFSANCFRPPEVVNFSNDGQLPKATYFGNRYGADITNTAPGTLPPCGYQPSDIEGAYGLDAAYEAGLSGGGQTMVIVDAYGSPTLANDAGTFSDFYGLAPLNLKIYEPFGPPSATTPANAAGWAAETTIDVEWSHSVAPGANVAVVVAVSDNLDDLAAAILWAVDHHLGNVIGDSWGSPEAELAAPPPYDFGAFESILVAGAAAGISVDFSSGDDGDFSTVEGITDVAYPASSPNGTAVGGTTLALNKNGSAAFQTGWGNDITRIAGYEDAKGFNPPLVPPLFEGFIGGAGGGASRVFAKPEFQRRLWGNHRLVPDVAYLADPFTGVEIICTDTSCGLGDTGGLTVAVYGGTSVAVQMFSGVWAIANQLAGHPLGQAARTLYALPHRALTDILPVGSPFDARGFIVTSSGLTYESPRELAQPVETWAPFYSALYQGTSTRWYVLSFGTDTSLFTAPGWDDVTGLGVPNGLPFIEAAAHPYPY